MEIPVWFYGLEINLHLKCNSRHTCTCELPKHRKRLSNKRPESLASEKYHSISESLERPAITGDSARETRKRNSITDRPSLHYAVAHPWRRPVKLDARKLARDPGTREEVAQADPRQACLRFRKKFSGRLDGNRARSRKIRIVVVARCISVLNRRSRQPSELSNGDRG